MDHLFLTQVMMIVGTFAVSILFLLVASYEILFKHTYLGKFKSGWKTNEIYVYLVCGILFFLGLLLYFLSLVIVNVLYRGVIFAFL